MTIIKRILILIPLSLSLSACNTVYKQQNSCLSKDWFTSGFDAAKNGLEINSQWSNISQLCVENNIWVDRRSYDEGYGLGLNYFCTQTNGFEFGQRALSYNEICTAQEQQIFNDAYADGINLYNAINNLEDNETLLDEYYYTIENAQPRIDEITHILDNNEFEDKIRKQYLKERRNLKYDRDYAERHIYGLQRSIEEGSRRLAKLEFELFEKHYGQNNNNDKFSLDETVHIQHHIIDEPAIIIYRPKKLSSDFRSHFNKTTKEINLFVTQSSFGDVRYQIIGNTDIKFIDEKQQTLTIGNNIKAEQPLLFLWHADSSIDLTTISYQTKTPEELLTEVENFINQQNY